MIPVTNIGAHKVIASGLYTRKQVKTAAYKVMSDTLSNVAPKSVHQLNLRAIKPSNISETAAAIKNGRNHVGVPIDWVTENMIIAKAANNRTLVIRLGMFFIPQAYKMQVGSIGRSNTFRSVGRKTSLQDAKRVRTHNKANFLIREIFVNKCLCNSY